MPQPDTALDLDRFFAAIVKSIWSAYPRLQLVEAFRTDRRNLALPACLIELVELEPTDNPGTEQLAVVAHIEATVIVDFRDMGAKVQVAKLAADIAHHAQGQRWGLPVEAATISAIAPSDFDPDLDQFEVWAVEWRQTIHIGKSIWDDGDPFPSEVLTSHAPNIGVPHEGDYAPLEGI